MSCDRPTNPEHTEAKRVDGRWILLGFPILAFGAGVVGALVLGNRQLLWTFGGLWVFWAAYLCVLEWVHRRRSHF